MWSCRYSDCPGERLCSPCGLMSSNGSNSLLAKHEDPARLCAAKHQPVSFHMDFNRIAEGCAAHEPQPGSPDDTHLLKSLSGGRGKTGESCNRALFTWGKLLQRNRFHHQPFLSVSRVFTHFVHVPNICRLELCGVKSFDVQTSSWILLRRSFTNSRISPH